MTAKQAEKLVKKLAKAANLQAKVEILLGDVQTELGILTEPVDQK